jgi:hypothetical protein
LQRSQNFNRQPRDHSHHTQGICFRLSLNRYTFCQISWLVNIKTFHCGDMVGEELERQNRQERR